MSTTYTYTITGPRGRTYLYGTVAGTEAEAMAYLRSLCRAMAFPANVVRTLTPIR